MEHFITDAIPLLVQWTGKILESGSTIVRALFLLTIGHSNLFIDKRSKFSSVSRRLMASFKLKPSGKMSYGRSRHKRVQHDFAVTSVRKIISSTVRLKMVTSISSDYNRTPLMQRTHQIPNILRLFRRRLPLKFMCAKSGGIELMVVAGTFYADVVRMKGWATTCGYG